MFVAIEGIIGAGKSTLTKALCELSPAWGVMPEPSYPELLHQFYGNPRRWAFPLQMWMLHARHEQQQIAARSFRTSMHLMDRSLLGDRIFASMHHRLGNFSSEEWTVYKKCAAVMGRPEPAAIIFLDVEPSVAWVRTRSRQAVGDSRVSLQYLEDLRKEYDRELHDHEWNKLHPPIFRFSWNNPSPADVRAVHDTIASCVADESNTVSIPLI